MKSTIQFTKKEGPQWDSAYNDAMHFCQSNTTEVIARQMAADMLKIQELKAELDKLGPTE